MPLNEEQSLELSTLASLRLDDIEGIALRLAPFLTEESETTGDMAVNARLLASMAFAANGEIVANQYRKHGSLISKSRNASDLPVQPAANFAEALELANSAVDNAARVAEALPALFEKAEQVPGGEIGAEADDSYHESIKTRLTMAVRLSLALQHGLVLINSGFDFDGISAAVKPTVGGANGDGGSPYV